MTPDIATDTQIHCPECDYNLTGAAGDRCPWCGWKIDPDRAIEVATEDPRGRRIGIIVASGFLGLGSWVVLGILTYRGRDLSVYDGLTAVAVLAAGTGHVCLAVLAAIGQPHWPLRFDEAATVLRFVGWFSVVTGVIGATAALETPTVVRGGQGIPVSGSFAFVILAAFFTLPGWTLLGLRLVSFRARPVRHDTALSGAAGTDRSHTRVPDLKSGGPSGALPGRAPFGVEVARRYGQGQLSQEWTDTPCSSSPALEAAIARTWETEQTLARQTGALLYNGELARLIRADATPSKLHLVLGPTCYRDFLGTNLHGTALARQSGTGTLSNALGVSVIVNTTDGYLAFGRRSRRVVCHAMYLHPFGGMVEVIDRTKRPGRLQFDVVLSARRELCEELGIRDDDIRDLTIVGLVRDRALQQPELLFDGAVDLTRERLTKCFDHSSSEREHAGIEFLHDDPDTPLPFFDRAQPITPVAQAALLLHGYHQWGPAWYEQCCYVCYGELPPTCDRST